MAATLDKTDWKSGPRVHPAIHAELKGRAAYEGESMDEFAHRLLCEALDRLDLLQQVPSEPAVSAS